MRCGDQRLPLGQNLDIRVDRVGSGAPLVCLNGLLGQNEQWEPVVRPLASRVESWLLQPPLLEMKGPGCSVHGVTTLLTGVLETLLDQPAVICGNSLGGHVALKVARARPDLVRALVLVGSSGLFERGFERDVSHNGTREWLDRKIADLFCDPDRMPDGLVDRAFEELSRKTARRALVKLGRSAKRDHLGDHLAEIHTPTLVAWGTHDRVTPPDVAEEFIRLLPDAELVWLDRCGHAPQIEDPAQLAEAIDGFLDRLDARDDAARSGVA